MRGLRTAAALLVVLIGLSAYIYFVEWKRPPASEVPAKPKAFELKPDQIAQFTITTGAGETTTLTKTAGQWQITAPVATKADETVLAAMTKDISGLEIERVVDEKPTELKQYGLDPPRVDVSVKASGAKDAPRMLIGDKTVTGTDVFAKLGSDPKVLLVPASIDDAFNKGTFDLRDKSVANVDRDALDSLQIASPRQTVRLTRRGTDWDLKQPLQLRGDNGVVGELLTKLYALQMKSVAVPETSGTIDLAKYGLDKPAYTVTLGAGSALETLQIGVSADESTVYARDVSRPVIFTIDRAFTDDLKKDPSEFRRKDVLDFETMDATGLEVTRAGKTTVYVRTTATGNAAQAPWREVSPAAGDIDPAKMQTALGKLAYLRAVGFVDPKKAGARESSAVTVAVKYQSDKEGKKEERVTIGKLGADPVAERAGWPDAGKLDSNAYATLIDALNDLTPKTQK